MAESFKLLMVKLDDLDVDSYQRGLVQSRVDALVANWDMAKVNVIHISARGAKEEGGGKWYVVDGQHEVAAALKRGIHELPAIVWKGQNKAREAEIFHDKQVNRYAVSPEDLFNARVEAGDKNAIDILGILAVRGMNISGMGGADGWNNVTAIKALEEVHDWKHLAITLDVLKAAFPDQPMAFQRQFLLAVGALYKNYGGLLDTDRLITHLQGTSLLVLRQAAEGMRAGFGGSLWPHIAQLMLAEYNQNLPAKSRLDHFHKPTLQRPGKFRLNRRQGGAAAAAE